MWCTSRASPVSTTRPTRVRVFSPIRWWCTALTRSRDGIGASSAELCRSDSTMILAPSSMASLTRAAHLVEGLLQRSPSGRRPVTGNRPSMAKARKPGMSPSSLM